MRLSDSDSKSKYEEFSDEELILRLRDGEQGIEDYIMNKYKNLVKSKAKSMFILGGESDDLIQEGMIGLFKAIRDYDAGRDASFFTFADLCVSRQLYTAVSASGRKKHMPLNTYVSLSYDDSGDDSVILYDSYQDNALNNPERMLIDQENVDTIEKLIVSELSDFERQAIELHLTGMSYSQIARVLGKDDKSTDNALSRAKNKLKKLLN